MEKKVLHILPSTSLAGAENVAICIISNLVDSFGCAYVSPEGDIKDVLSSRGIDYIPLRNFSSSEIRKVLKEWKPDIIHAHDFTATIKCLFSTISIPVISHIHQNPSWLRTLNLRSILFFLACFKLSKIVLVSPAIKQKNFLSYFFKGKSIVIKNIVDISWITKKATFQTSESYDLAFVGRFEEVKDPLRFIKIVSEVIKELPSVKAIMMGGGTLEDECRNAIRAKGMQNNLVLRGFLGNPYPIIKKSKILVMTSKSEGLPMVAIEALALGKPIIVPQLVGIENIVNKECGYTCKTNIDFVNQIITLLRSEKKYQQMSVAALRKAEDICSMDMYIEQLKKVYHDAIHK
ncbi:glycosyltransferase [Sporosarcina luteola]|nr:glycosyltransferase [Sporosarcina luteola]